MIQYRTEIPLLLWQLKCDSNVLSNYVQQSLQSHISYNCKPGLTYFVALQHHFIFYLTRTFDIANN